MRGAAKGPGGRGALCGEEGQGSGGWGRLHVVQECICWRELSIQCLAVEAPPFKIAVGDRGSPV